MVSIVQNGILKQRSEPTMKIPMGGPLLGFSPCSGPLVKIFTIQKQHILQLHQLYIVFMGYLSTILAHKPLKFVVLTHENLYLSLGGPCYDVDPLFTSFNAYPTSDSLLSQPCTHISCLSSFWLIPLTTVYSYLTLIFLLTHSSHNCVLISHAYSTMTHKSPISETYI